MATNPAQGFLLLTIDNVQIKALSLPLGTDTGTLNLECVTLPDAARDVWLVLRLNAFEMVISPTQVIYYSRSVRNLVFSGLDGSAKEDVTLQLPPPATPAEEDDLETLEVILAQYGALHIVDGGLPEKGNENATKFDGEEELKGRLVLVDENDGEVVGTLSEKFRINEDAALREKGREKDPVLVDISQKDPDTENDVFVHMIPYEQQDLLMKSATMISRGILYATDALTTGMTAASSYYINHTTPNEKPLVFSESTRGHVRRMHNVSGKAVRVTAKTTGLINDAIGRAMTYVAGNGSGSKGKEKAREEGTISNINGKSGPPPLPPRKLDPSTGHLQRPSSTSTAVAPELPPRPPLANRILLSTDLLLTTLENSAKHLVEHSTLKISESLGHKYGHEMAAASMLVGHSVRNVGVVYIDARGVGRRALLKTAGKTYIKARIGKREVVLGVDEHGHVEEAQAGGAVVAKGTGGSALGTGAEVMGVGDVKDKNV